MDIVNLNEIMHTTLKCKARWAVVEPHGVTLLCTQRREFQWKGSLLMLPTGQL